MRTPTIFTVYIKKKVALPHVGHTARAGCVGGEAFQVPSPFRFNVDTQHKTSHSGAHPNQMKQLRMILKAQELYFALHTSTVNKYEDDMTNSGQ